MSNLIIMEKEIEVLSQYRLLFWAVLAHGVEQEWFLMHEIEYFALKKLETNPNESDYRAALLAVGNHYDSLQECKTIIQELAKNEIELQTRDIINILKFADLTVALESESELEQFEKLQEVIRKFDYPEKLYYCDMYHLGGTDTPLVIAQKTANEILKNIHEATKLSYYPPTRKKIQ
jgi:hypothetical protein